MLFDYITIFFSFLQEKKKVMPTGLIPMSFVCLHKCKWQLV